MYKGPQISRTNVQMKKTLKNFLGTNVQRYKCTRKKLDFDEKCTNVQMYNANWCQIYGLN